MSSVEPEIKIGNYRWVPSDVFQLIELVKENPAIYNPQDKNYFCRPFVENIWREIDIKMKKNPGCSLAKWTNLRICFRREYATFMSESIKPSWTFFEGMFFLHPYLRKKRSNPERLETHIQEALEQINSITRGNMRNYVKRVESIESCDEPESFAGGSRSTESEDDDCLMDENLIKEESIEANNSRNSNNYEIEPTSGTENNISNNSSHGNDETISLHEQSVEVDQQNNTSNFQGFSINEMAETENRYNAFACINRMNKKLAKAKKLKKRHNSYENFPNPEVKLLKHSIQEIKTSIDCKNTKSEEGMSDSSRLCDCKTDPDAMFLMSLLPDIQSLSRRDKGKFKIEVQKLIQDLLYP